MRTCQMLTSLLTFAGLVLTAAPPALAASADFSINFAAVQQATNQSSESRTVQTLVGTNESANNPGVWKVYASLEVKGPAGFSCWIANTVQKSYSPPDRFPLRFVVEYQKSPLALPTRHVRYSLTATIISINPAPTGDSPGDNQRQVTVDLPVGGTPSCQKL